MSRSFLCCALAFVAGCLVLFGCGTPPAITDENAAKFDYVVARADSGYVLTARQLYDFMKKSDVQPAGGYVPESTIQAFQDSIVADSLMGFEANHLNVRDYYSDWWTCRLRCDDILLQTYLEHRVYGKVSVDSNEVLQFYKDRPELFKIPAQVELYHILVVPQGLKNGRDSLYYRSLSPERFEEEMRDYAFSLYQLLGFGESFQNVALQYSQDTGTRSKGGYQGWTALGTYMPPFDSVAFALNPGEYSKPYRDRDGWHILYITGKVPEGPAPISRSEVYESARQSLLTTKSNQIGRVLLDSVHADTKLRVNTAILDTNIYAQPDSLWAAIVNSVDTFDCKYMKNLELGYARKYNVVSTTPDMKKEMVAYLAERFTLIQYARKAGYDTLKETREQLAAINHQTARSILERSQFDVTWAPSDSAVEQYYSSHPEQFVVTKPLVVQQIVCSDSLFAEYLRDQADAGVDFLDLAKQYYPGEASVRVELANLGAIGPKDVDSEFYLAALATPAGTVSRPIKTRYGFQIIKVLKREDSRTFDQARGEIITLLGNENRRDQIRAYRLGLFQKYHATFPRLLKSAHLKPLGLRRK